MSDYTAGSLTHEGVKRRSGRYPWGSGKNPQRNKSLRTAIKELEAEGLSQRQIAKGFNMSIREMKAKVSLEVAAERKADMHLARELRDKGLSNTEIGRRMGKNESTIRSLLDADRAERTTITEKTAEVLRNQLKEKPFLDVGKGVEQHLGITRNRLDNALFMLEDEGYHVVAVQVPQLGTTKKTTLKVLTSKDNDYVKIVRDHMDDIRTVTDWSEDGGRSFLGLVPVRSIDSKRVKVLFDEDGGSNKDGVIELRRGVSDLDLGKSRYAQVRIAVDENFYMKGMAIYRDDMPDGVDVIYNSNKSKKVGKMGAFKPVEDDADNPFGSTVRQKFYIDKDGNTKVSALNIMGSKPGDGEEGAWDKWSRTLSSQFLSKQNPRLASEQLDLTYKIQKSKFDEIMTITNPAVRQRLLDSFSDECDSQAVYLKATSLPRQSNKVLIPIPSLRENEAYTTSYENGTKLALIRHPHGGIFEIATVTVNNKNREGKKVLADAIDAIGIHPKVAGILSGADFDGDHVLAVPLSNKIKRSKPLDDLKDFDPKIYKGDPNVPFKVMTKGNMQNEMGRISNLITDMTIQGASTSEIARAVKHSMVVIDAKKHELDYTQSFRDHGIARLKEKYQGGANRGASTLISKSKSEERISLRRPATNKDLVKDPSLSVGKLVRKNDYSIDSATGKKVWVTEPEVYYDKKGRKKERLIKSSKMYETDDAFTLSSGTEIERVYATYANNMKALGDLSRKESASIQPTKQSPSAKKAYANEVAALTAKLNRAESNAPLERQAQVFGNAIIKRKKAENPDMTYEELTKKKGQALEEARKRVGAKKTPVVITDREWEAIQANALSWNKLQAILTQTSEDSVKALALPQAKRTLSPSKKARARSMIAKGYSLADISYHLDVPLDLLSGLSREGE